MAGNRDQKVKILYLLDILEKYSDEEHPINAVQICELLGQSGIYAERKSIYSDIEKLRLKGYDIIFTKVPKTGFFLAERPLELAEVRLLTDAVQAAGFITRKKSLELTDKLKQFVSVYQAQELASQIYIDHRKKAANEEIYYTIDALHRAIAGGKKTELKYDRFEVKSGIRTLREKTFVISPYAMMWWGDRYYVVANNEKYDDLMHLRIDRIKKITVLDEDSRPFCEVSEYRDVFDTADYASKIFNAFGGETVTVTLRCKNETADAMADLFGSSIVMRPSDTGHFTFNVKAAMSLGLVQSLMQFGADIEVLSPDCLRNQIAEKSRQLCSLYGG